jgi:phosphatidylethanolamine/phosphatidyl-N-methylethanolamine N-methyltransferase
MTRPLPVLGRRFPHARVFNMDAAELTAAGLYAGATVGAVISGLGILAMPADKASAILGGAFACMVPGGAFYQITYGPRCPVPQAILDRLGLEAVRTGWTMRNLPPASVYRIMRHRSCLPSAL